MFNTYPGVIEVGADKGLRVSPPPKALVRTNLYNSGIGVWRGP